MHALKIIGWGLAAVLLLVSAVAIGGAPLIVKLIEMRGSSRLGREISVGRLEVPWGSPIRLHPIGIAAHGLFQRQPFSLTAELAPFAELHRRGWPSPVRLDGRLGANAISLVGTTAEPLSLQDLDLRVDMAGQDLHQVLATL